MKSTPDRQGVAVIGMAAVYPGARDLGSFWQNILGKVDAVREAPPEWGPIRADPERVYTRRIGYIGDVAEFDPSEFGIMPKAVEGGIPDQYLALRVARDALRDAGYGDGGFDRERAGVILGHGNYMDRGFVTFVQHAISVDQTVSVLRQVCPDMDDDSLARVREGLEQSLPGFNTDMSPGLVPNIISGRVANRLNLMGPNFIVDAACASSLVAVELSMRELRTGRCDLVLTGGVHAVTTHPFVRLFCMLGALSRGDIRPFDAAASGTLLGGGVGVLVLKRLEDAERDGDRVYAVIRGTGSSSDGKGMALLTPRAQGQVLALERAYEDSGIEPATVGLIEAHGTGIPVGDRTELESLRTVFGERGAQLPRCAMGSVKSMIGHCLPASGAASLIKTVLALHHKVLPPTLVDTVNPALDIEHTPFYVNKEVRPWFHADDATPRRAGVNAFGFGGVNAHVVLEEYRPRAAVRPLEYLNTAWPSELVVLAARDRPALLAQLSRLQAYLDAHPHARLADVARTLCHGDGGPCRLAVVADDIADLSGKLARAAGKIAGGKRQSWQTRTGVSYAEAPEPGGVMFLFPGEGAQYHGMLAELCCHFPKVRTWFEFLDSVFAEERGLALTSCIFPASTSLTDEERRRVDAELYRMDVGSEAVFVGGLAMYRLLSDLGVAPDAILGHSTGAITALAASGIAGFDLEDRRHLGSRMLELYRTYSSLPMPEGGLLNVGGLPFEQIEEYVSGHGGELHIALDNCPNQVIVFGSEEAVAKATQDLADLGAFCTRLPFGRAYHTPLFSEFEATFREFYDSLDVSPGSCPVYSCVSTRRLPGDAEGIRALAASEMSSRVRFRETIERAYEDGFRTFVEVGPSANVTAFVDDILRRRDYAAVATNSQSRGALEQLQRALGQLFVRGVAMDLSGLYASRSLQVLPILEDADPARESLPPAPPHRLDLNLPVIAAPPGTQVHAPAAARTAPDRGDIAREPARPRDATAGVTPPAPSAGAAPVREGAGDAPPAAGAWRQGDGGADAATEALLSHFRTMRQFLDNQSRVMAMLYGEDDGAGVPRGAAPAPAAGAMRFPLLGEVVERGADRLVCERSFSLETDPVLCDHTLGGRVSASDPGLYGLPVIPFTFSMELMAEAASALADGSARVVGVRNARGHRWLTLEHGVLTLRSVATWTVSGRADSVSVSVYAAGNGDSPAAAPVFEGEVMLASHYPQAPAPLQPDASGAVSGAPADAELYSGPMFHGPRLQGVKHVRWWNDSHIEAELEALPSADFVAGAAALEFETDPVVLDAAGQLLGYWLTEREGYEHACFPYRVDEYRQYRAPATPGTPLTCRAHIRRSGEGRLDAKLDVLGPDGALVARVTGWQDRGFVAPRRFYELRVASGNAWLSEALPLPGAEEVVCRRVKAFPEGFLEDSLGIWRKVLAHLVLSRRERAWWYELPERGSRRTEWLLGRVAAKDAVRAWSEERTGLVLAPADVEIVSAPNGQPMVECPDLSRIGMLPHISIAHSGQTAMAAAAGPDARVGIDFEVIGRADAADLRRSAFAAGEVRLIDRSRAAGDDVLLLATWCAKEAAAKADGTGLGGDPRTWQAIRIEEEGFGVVVAHAGDRFHALWCRVDDMIVAVSRKLRGVEDGGRAVSHAAS